MKTISRIAALLGLAACAACSTLSTNSDGRLWRESQCRAKYGAPCAELDRQRIEYDLRDVVETGG